jgi:hypothetical protein
MGHRAWTAPTASCAPPGGRPPQQDAGDCGWLDAICRTWHSPPSPERSVRYRGPFPDTPGVERLCAIAAIPGAIPVELSDQVACFIRGSRTGRAVDSAPRRAMDLASTAGLPGPGHCLPMPTKEGKRARLCGVVAARPGRVPEDPHPQSLHLDKDASSVPVG